MTCTVGYCTRLSQCLTSTSWFSPIPSSISLACSLTCTIQSVPCITWVPCYIPKGGACTSVHMAINGDARLTTGISYRNGYMQQKSSIPNDVHSMNKYFKLRNSWGYCPNSNYLLASVVLGKSITHVWNTHVNCTVCRHTKHADAVTCAHAHIHTQLTTHATHTHMHTRTHTHTVYMHSTHKQYTQKRHTASTDCHSYQHR